MNKVVIVTLASVHIAVKGGGSLFTLSECAY